MSSNGFGRIWHKTKRRFHLTYTPIKVFMQASYDAKLSLKDTFRDALFKRLENQRIQRIAFYHSLRFSRGAALHTPVLYIKASGMNQP